MTPAHLYDEFPSRVCSSFLHKHKHEQAFSYIYPTLTSTTTTTHGLHLPGRLRSRLRLCTRIRGFTVGKLEEDAARRQGRNLHADERIPAPAEAIVTL